MKHAILGPGGVGGMLGACLAKNGHEVTLVVRPGGASQYPRELQLESPFGNFSAPVEISEKVPPTDVLWVCVKATQLDAALEAVSAENLPQATLPLLNGIDHVALLRSRFGADRVYGATIAVEAERVAPGRVIHRSPFARLQVIATAQKLLSGMFEQFQKMGFICQFIEDEPTLLWGKLALLAPVALTTSAAGAPKGTITSDPQWHARLEGCVRECCAVGVAEGARLDVEKGLAALLGLPANMRSSMQKDLEAGNPIELDAIGRTVLRTAARHGLPVPITQGLVTAVEERAARVREARNSAGTRGVA
jgi:2-dehydropantoate 2-reductase